MKALVFLSSAIGLSCFSLTASAQDAAPVANAVDEHGHKKGEEGEHEHKDGEKHAKGDKHEHGKAEKHDEKDGHDHSKHKHKKKKNKN